MRPTVVLRLLREGARRERLLRELRGQAVGVSVQPTVQVRSADRLRLGRDAAIDHGVFLHCGGTEWSMGEGGIVIGARTYVGPGSTLFGAGGIELGDDVLVSPGVVITSHQHTFTRLDAPIREQPLEFGRVVIESDVWIGANATVLPGVTIGAGSIIGAGAVVAHDVQPRCIAVGVPAREVRGR
jgi:acetyltransferase-like isoleucine patch superfamily enzyme